MQYKTFWACTACKANYTYQRSALTHLTTAHKVVKVVKVVEEDRSPRKEERMKIITLQESLYEFLLDILESERRNAEETGDAAQPLIEDIIDAAKAAATLNPDAWGKE